jgi:hypothetical protein
MVNPLEIGLCAHVGHCSDGFGRCELNVKDSLRFLNFGGALISSVSAGGLKRAELRLLFKGRKEGISDTLGLDGADVLAVGTAKGNVRAATRNSSGSSGLASNSSNPSCSSRSLYLVTWLLSTEDATPVGPSRRSPTFPSTATACSTFQKDFSSLWRGRCRYDLELAKDARRDRFCAAGLTSLEMTKSCIRLEYDV